MKTTYELSTEELKIVLKLWMVSVGIPVLDSDQFSIDPKGKVTISIDVPIPEEGPIPVTPPIIPPVVPPDPVIPPVIQPPTDTDRARCDKFSTKFTFPAECAYVHGSHDRIPEDVTYENVPGDNGGLTKWGIDAGGHPLLSSDFIKDMTMQQALDQYYITWNEQKCSTLPSPIGEVVHDTYESGGRPIRWLQQTLDEADPSHAIHWLQSAVNVTVDGMLGPETLGAVAAVTNPSKIALDFLIRRDAYFNGLADSVGHDAQFRQGWLNRDTNLRKYLNLS